MKTHDGEIDVAAILYKAADAIRYMERIAALHDCNDCGRKGDCPIMPNYGAETRINCFFWSNGNEPVTVQTFRMMNEKGREA